MRAILCVWVLASGCAARAGYVERSDTAKDIPPCETMSCGGTADPLAMGLGISVLVGLAIATLWER